MNIENDDVAIDFKGNEVVTVKFVCSNRNYAKSIDCKFLNY